MEKKGVKTVSMKSFTLLQYLQENFLIVIEEGLG